MHAGVTTLATIVDQALAQPRFSMLLVGGFGVVALLLACVGLYGAVSYAVTSRTQEIGVRLALGAPRRRILTLVLRDCLRITVIGVALGLALSAIVLKAIDRFLYGVDATDPATFIALSPIFVPPDHPLSAPVSSARSASR